MAWKANHRRPTCCQLVHLPDDIVHVLRHGPVKKSVDPRHNKKSISMKVSYDPTERCESGCQASRHDLNVSWSLLDRITIFGRSRGEGKPRFDLVTDFTSAFEIRVSSVHADILSACTPRVYAADGSGSVRLAHVIGSCGSGIDDRG